MSAMQNGRGYVLQQQIGFVLRLAFQSHTPIFATHMVGALTQPQFAALWTLRSIGQCSQNNLGRLTAVDSATIKGVVTRLQQRGLLRAASDAADRRRLVLTVTPAGAALLDRAEHAATAITEATLVNLASEERDQLLRLLAKIGTSAAAVGPKMPMQLQVPKQTPPRPAAHAKKSVTAKAIASRREAGA